MTEAPSQPPLHHPLDSKQKMMDILGRGIRGVGQMIHFGIDERVDGCFTVNIFANLNTYSLAEVGSILMMKFVHVCR